MKTVMKFALVKAILLLMTTSAAAATATTTINQQAVTGFTDSSGNVGFVAVTRHTDPTTKVITTTLQYSFCVQTTAASCLEGSGVIPNSGFIGTLDGKIKKSESVKLLADTTIAGFSNVLCNGPEDLGGCIGGTSPATGGLISVNFVTEVGYIEVFTIGDRKVENFTVTLNSTDQTSQGPASAQGSVLGTSINEPAGAGTWGFETLSGVGSPGSKLQKAQSHMNLENALPPNALKRLQRLRGEQPAQ